MSVSQIDANWWNERRRRDYYVDDATGEIKLKAGSPTYKLAVKRVQEEAALMAMLRQTVAQ